MNVPIQDLTSEMADYSYCEKCECKIPFRVGQSGSKKHMRRHHPDLLLEFEKKLAEEASTKMAPLINAYRNERTIVNTGFKMISDDDQDYFNELVAKWVAEDQRSFSEVEDQRFRELIQYVASLGGIQLSIPMRGKTQEEVKRLATELRSSLMTRIVRECEYYCLTTDIWTDRAMRSFMALTIHYLDQEFNMNRWTLEVIHFPGRHTGASIAQFIDKQTRKWGLDKSRCVRLVRDGAANAKLAGELLGMEHESCIAHSLHLVVGALLIKKSEDKNVATEELHNFADNVAEFETATEQEHVEFLEATVKGALMNEEFQVVSRVRAVVQRFRKIAAYFNRSAKGADILARLQKEHRKKGDAISVKIDCVTRWNSTRDMLSCLQKLKVPLEHFFAFINSEGKSQFKDVRKNLVRPTEEDWLIIKCLLLMLGPFRTVSDNLSGETYPTLATSFTALRWLKQKLMNQNMFNDIAVTGGGHEYVQLTIAIMEKARLITLKLFEDRFAKMSVDCMWIAMLDPRQNLQFLTEAEIDRSQKWLIHDCVDLATAPPTSPVATVIHIDDEENEDDTPKKLAAELRRAMFRTNDAATQTSLDNTFQLRELCNAEFSFYKMQAAKVTGEKCNPLVWWRENGKQFPIIKKCARKWLCCVATSVPSERAFSTGGIVVSNKRCSLDPDSVRDLVFLAQNAK